MTIARTVWIQSVHVVLLLMSTVVGVFAQDHTQDPGRGVLLVPQAPSVRQSDPISSENDSRDGFSLDDGETKLQILTYNTQFRDTIADVLAPGWPNTKGRAQAIGRM